MKIKEGFILRTVVGETVVLPTGGVTNLDMMITLNDSGKFLWEKLEHGAEKHELVDSLLKEYNIDRKTAEKSVNIFVARLKEIDILA